MPALNEYLPFASKIVDVIRHTDIEYTFRMEYAGEVKPGQFFEISMPKYGEAPISVSGIDEGAIDFTIRRVGKVTGEIFERSIGDALFLRGPYGNGFDIADYQGHELVVIAGGTGVSPVRGVVDYFSAHSEEVESLTFIAGFRSPKDVLFRSDFERWEKAASVILTTDSNEGDESYRQGLVTAYIPNLSLKDVSKTRAIVVGPPAMMRFSVMGLIEKGFQEENIWISMERKMCCGLGKCGHCKVAGAYICLDGPVFRYSEGKGLED